MSTHPVNPDDGSWPTHQDIEDALRTQAAQAPDPAPPPDRGPGQASPPPETAPALPATPEASLPPPPTDEERFGPVPEHARQLWHDQNQSLGRPPSTMEWRRAMGGRSQVTDGWRRMLLREAQVQTTGPTLQGDSQAVTQARVNLAAAHQAVVKHTGVTQDFRDERSALVLALQTLHRRRAATDDVSISEIHESEARIRAIDLELTEVFLAVLASLQAEETNCRRQLHQAVELDQIERLNGMTQALRDFYQHELEPSLLHLLDLGQAAIQKIGQIATVRTELGLAPGDGSRTLIAWFYSTLSPSFPHPLADQWRRLGRTWPTVVNLLEADTTLVPIQPEQLAEEVRRSRVFVRFIGPGVPTLHVAGLERLQGNLQVDADFKSGRPIELDRAEHDALLAHFGAAVERCLPTAASGQA
jgi:hypothetical protein